MKKIKLIKVKIKKDKKVKINSQWFNYIFIYLLIYTYDTGRSTALAANCLCCNIREASSTPLLVPLITTWKD